jgi:hypothetical protein
MFFFDVTDKDGDGQINWSEFVEFQISSQKVLKANWPVDIASIRKEFSEMDEDANGKISKNEFIQAFENIHKRLVNIPKSLKPIYNDIFQRKCCQCVSKYFNFS